MPKKRAKNIKLYNQYIDKMDFGKSLKESFSIGDEDHPQEWIKDYPYLNNQDPRGGKIKLKILFEGWVHALKELSPLIKQHNTFLPHFFERKLHYLRSARFSAGKLQEQVLVQQQQVVQHEEEQELQQKKQVNVSPKKVRIAATTSTESSSSLEELSADENDIIGKQLNFHPIEPDNELNSHEKATAEQEDSLVQSDSQVVANQTQKVRKTRSGRQIIRPKRFRDNKAHYSPRPVKSKKRTG